MPEEMNSIQTSRRKRHRGRFTQIPIYLGKQLRFFINQSDWKVLPMAAVIAGLVGMVIRSRMFINMEGSLIGGFALTCVAIWNGCFNSIQSVVRERPIIKREHRSGMHISSYIAAHMIYQLMLCLLQTAVTMYALVLMGVKFPASGFITPWMILDVGISMLLISYASDMMSLFISSVSHTTTGAMTVMPFVLIFQLVFAGGIIPLPERVRPICNLTISNYGVKVLTAQGGYNDLPMVTVWSALSGMRDKEIGGSFTVGEFLDALDNPLVEKHRDREILSSYTVGDVTEMLRNADKYLHLRDIKLIRKVPVREVVETTRQVGPIRRWLEKVLVPGDEDTSDLTLGDLLDRFLGSETLQELLDREIGTEITLGRLAEILHLPAILEQMKDVTLNQPVTLGQIVDYAKNSTMLREHAEDTITVKTTVGEVLDFFGEENVKNLIQTATADASRKPEYDLNLENILSNWFMLVVFIVFFALLSTISLELIDKDKRTL